MRYDFSEKTKAEFLDECLILKCMFKNCGNSLKRKGRYGTSGIFCHIIAASMKGPRYDSNYSPEFIESTKNCIIMCRNCSGFIDEEKDSKGNWKYSAVDLFKMRAEYFNKLEHINDTFSYSSLYEELKEFLEWFSNRPLKLDNKEYDNIELPIDIVEKIQINDLPKQYIESVKRVSLLKTEIDELINEKGEIINRNIREIQKYYIDLKKETAAKDFIKIVEFILQENKDY